MGDKTTNFCGHCGADNRIVEPHNEYCPNDPAFNDEAAAVMEQSLIKSTPEAK